MQVTAAKLANAALPLFVPLSLAIVHLSVVAPLRAFLSGLVAIGAEAIAAVISIPSVWPRLDETRITGKTPMLRLI